MDIFKDRRSIRKFKNEKLSDDDLNYIADCARLAPQTANVQPLKFCVITEKAGKIFKYVKWAGYLPEWSPKEEEAPPAYIGILGDETIKKDGFETDAGIAGAAICYSAQSRGISSCWLGAIDREKIAEILGLEKKYKLLYLIALGKAAQKSDVFDSDDSVKYEIDGEENFSVPKRKFESVVFYR